jgi:hypothetical protein
VAVSGREAVEGPEVGGVVENGAAPEVEAKVGHMESLTEGLTEDGEVGGKG